MTEQEEFTTKKEIKKAYRPLWEMIQALLIALVIKFVLRSYVFQPFWVPTTSMVTTLQVTDRILVNELSLRYDTVERGDVMVFRYPLDPEVIYVKRMIGLPGEMLEIRADGVYIDGEKIEEPYLVQDYGYDPMGPIRVPDDAYFAMGDNRDYSADSRIWGFVPEENFVGRAFFIYWPMSSLGTID